MIGILKGQPALALACSATIFALVYSGLSLLYQEPPGNELKAMLVWMITFTAADLIGVILEAFLGQ